MTRHSYPPPPGPSEAETPRPVDDPPAANVGTAERLHRAMSASGFTTENYARALALSVVDDAIRCGVTPDSVAIALTRRMAEVFVADLAVFLRKQVDYGPGNISAFGAPGVMIRSHDKVERIKTLLSMANHAGASIRAAVHGEAVDDTLGDLTNYGAIGRLVLRGLWPAFEDPTRCPAP